MAKKKAKTTTRLSKTEKAVLARFQKSTDLFEEYKSAVNELTAAKQAVEATKQALHNMPQEHVATIAEVDPEAAELFRALGMLDGMLAEAAAPAAPPAEAPTAEEPALQAEPVLQAELVEETTEAASQPTEAPAQPAEAATEVPAPPADAPAQGNDAPAPPTDSGNDEGQGGHWILDQARNPR